MVLTFVEDRGIVSNVAEQANNKDLKTDGFRSLLWKSWRKKSKKVEKVVDKQNSAWYYKQVAESDGW